MEKFEKGQATMGAKLFKNPCIGAGLGLAPAKSPKFVALMQCRGSKFAAKKIKSRITYQISMFVILLIVSSVFCSCRACKCPAYTNAGRQEKDPVLWQAMAMGEGQMIIDY